MSDDDTSGASQPPAKAPYTPWHKGMPTPNKLGRKKGTPNCFSQKLISDFAADWREHGAAAIAELREFNVAAYVKTAGEFGPHRLFAPDLAADDQDVGRQFQQAAASGEHEAKNNADRARAARSAVKLCSSRRGVRCWARTKRTMTK